MWFDDPKPLHAPAVIFPVDQADLIALNLRHDPGAEVAGPSAEKNAPPTPAVARVAVVEPIVVPAQDSPWWLNPHDRDRVVALGSEPIPQQLPPQPSEADRAAALATALWMGGVALEISWPEPSAEEEEPPRGEPEADEDEAEE